MNTVRSQYKFVRRNAVSGANEEMGIALDGVGDVRLPPKCKAVGMVIAVTGAARTERRKASILYRLYNPTTASNKTTESMVVATKTHDDTENILKPV